MELEEAFHAWASGQTELMALIGGPNAFRLWKGQVPANSHFPATVQQRTGTGRTQRYCGPDKTVDVSLQIDHYGKTWKEAVDLARAFRVALQDANFPVMMGTLKVKVATLENEIDVDDPEPGLFRRSQSWSFWFAE